MLRCSQLRLLMLTHCEITMWSTYPFQSNKLFSHFTVQGALCAQQVMA